MADSGEPAVPSAPEAKSAQDQSAHRATAPSTATPPVLSSAPPAGSTSSSLHHGDGSRTGSYSSSSRVPYTPQFSAATQMILKRMRGETGGLGSALAAANAPGASTPTLPQSTYSSVRERRAADIKGGSGLSVPAPPSSSPSTTSTTLPLPVSSPKPGVATALAISGQKRKRLQDDGSDASSPAEEASDYGEGIKKTVRKSTPSSTPTTTKSGRQVLKPDTYDPAAEDNAKKRNRLGTRTTEQALCKRCTRMHSPATNQMVFCDGCNDPYHQRCHEPWIEDEVVKDPDVKWFCVVCASKRERLQPRKKAAVEQPRFGSWAGKPLAQVRSSHVSISLGDQRLRYPSEKSLLLWSAPN